MMNSQKLIKTVQLPGIIMLVLRQLKKQQSFLKERVSPVLKDALAGNDGSLDEADVKKINHYYGLAVPAILGEAFSILHGSSMTEQQRWASTCQGAMTGLFDDFFDKAYLSDAAVAAMINGNQSSPHKRSNEKLFDHFYREALAACPDATRMQQALLEVYNAQLESKKQTNGSLTEEELLKITFFKGGSSVNFYRTAFSPAPSKQETTLLYNLGGLMQLANDIFDVYKDRESNIQTLVTGASQISLVRNLLKERLAIYYRDAFGCGFDKKRARKFLDIISIGVFSRCFVCLNQLEGNERLSGNLFRVKAYSRSQLICDMDKPLNMLRSARSHVTDIP